jgi:hypothetical protein
MFLWDVFTFGEDRVEFAKTFIQATLPGVRSQQHRRRGLTIAAALVKKALCFFPWATWDRSVGEKKEAGRRLLPAG